MATQELANAIIPVCDEGRCHNVAVATGTKGGLLEEKRAQSVFKHAILKQYLPRFIAKTGYRTRQVVLVDGYAGTGASGAGPGSATLMLQAAQKVQATKSQAKVSVYLVESDPKNYQQLTEVAGMFRDNGILVEDRKGSIDKELPSITSAAREASLFLFLDPCGALLPFSSMQHVFAVQRGCEYPPTEALLNFSDDLVRRAAGQFLKQSSDQRGAQRLDQVCGGEWWRDIATRLQPRCSTDTYEPIAAAVANEYADKLSHATQTQAIVIPVAKKLGHQPIYHLIFLSRHPEGLWSFADSIAVSRPDWIAAMPDDPDLSEEDLFSGRDVILDDATLAAKMRRDAIKEQKNTVPKLVKNIAAIAAVNKRFRIIDHISEVFGDVLGVATEKQVRVAINELLKDKIAMEEKHKQLQRRIYQAI